MCLAALSVGQHRRYRFVLAANRDEYLARPAARIGWWLPEHGGPAVLGGRDLQGGGTWLGLNAAGRLALVTNVRQPGVVIDPSAPSRGGIVTDWLRGDEPSFRFWVRAGLAGYNAFNLIAFDFVNDERFWCGVDVAPRRLDAGLFGLSNAQLDTPWPKVVALKAAMRSAMAAVRSPQGLVERLLAALADRGIAPDEALPRTGVPFERERQLAPAFVQIPDPEGRPLYATRCSTVVVVEQTPAGLLTHVVERSFGPDGRAEADRRVQLSGWPPAPGDAWSVDAARLDERLHGAAA